MSSTQYLFFPGSYGQQGTGTFQDDACEGYIDTGGCVTPDSTAARRICSYRNECAGYICMNSDVHPDKRCFLFANPLLIDESGRTNGGYDQNGFFKVGSFGTIRGVATTVGVTATPAPAPSPTPSSSPPQPLPENPITPSSVTPANDPPPITDPSISVITITAEGTQAIISTIAIQPSSLSSIPPLHNVISTSQNPLSSPSSFTASLQTSLPSSSSMSPTTIAIIVTVPVGIIALILAALVVWMYTRLRATQTSEQKIHYTQPTPTQKRTPVEYHSSAPSVTPPSSSLSPPSRPNPPTLSSSPPPPRPNMERLDRVHIYTTPLINNPSPTSSKLSLDQWTPQDVSTFLRTCNIDEKTVILLNDSNVDGVALLYLSEKTLMGFGVKKEETRRMILGYVDTLRRHDGKNEEVLGDGRPPSYAYVNGTSG